METKSSVCYSGGESNHSGHGRRCGSGGTELPGWTSWLERLRLFSQEGSAVLFFSRLVLQGGHEQGALHRGWGGLAASGSRSPPQGALAHARAHTHMPAAGATRTPGLFLLSLEGCLGLPAADSPVDQAYE